MVIDRSGAAGLRVEPTRVVFCLTMVPFDLIDRGESARLTAIIEVNLNVISSRHHHNLTKRKAQKTYMREHNTNFKVTQSFWGVCVCVCVCVRVCVCVFAMD